MHVGRARKRKDGKLCISGIISSKRGITHTKNDASTVKQSHNYAKFQLIMSKHVREKCGKLSISSILSSKRGLTHTIIDAS